MDLVGYAVDEGVLLGTSKRAVELYAERYRAAGYGALLSLCPIDPPPGFEAARRPGDCLMHDGLAPTIGQMAASIRQIQTWRAADKKAIVHCLAGVGRTGTTLACWLVYARGLKPGDAIHAVRDAARAAKFSRIPPVENREQEDFVRTWKEWLQWRADRGERTI